MSAIIGTIWSAVVLTVAVWKGVGWLLAPGRVEWWNREVLPLLTPNVILPVVVPAGLVASCVICWKAGGSP